MTTVLLLHHALGLTDGVLAFAETLRSARCTVHVPDLYDGLRFDDLDEGVAHAESIGWQEIIRMGRAAAEDLPTDIVVMGFSLGALPAQSIAQTRAGTRGAVLFHAGEPTAEFGAPWPEGVPLQVHASEEDPWVDVEVLTALVAEAEAVGAGELFLYPGSAHLFADASLDGFEPGPARDLRTRTLAFLDRLG